MLFVIIGHAGRIPIAGPFLDGSGSLILVEADSLEEAWHLVAADP